MARATGIGGIFFKTADVAKLKQWYKDHLGIEAGDDGSAVFTWSEESGAPGMTVWALFAKDSPYFKRSGAQFMINYRVDDLDALLSQLRGAGVDVDENVEEQPYGRFGWITDPDGNRIELWEQPKDSSAE